MEKFVVTFVDGTQCVCYRNDGLITNFALVLSTVHPVMDRPGEQGAWSHGISAVGPYLNPEHSTPFLPLPRCYLNTEAGLDRLRLLAALAYGRYCRHHLEK